MIVKILPLIYQTHMVITWTSISIEVSLTYTKLATLPTKVYMGKIKINLAKNCLQWG